MGAGEKRPTRREAIMNTIVSPALLVGGFALMRETIGEGMN